MSFIAAEWLWLLVLLPLLPLLYVLALRRRGADALRFTDLDLLREAAAGRRAWRRHVPPALLFLALFAMLLALARPSALLTLPYERATVVLAIDVSGSMRAADIAPDRITVAKDAARAFVVEQPRTTRIGLVAFSTSAMISAVPTMAREEVLAAIDGLRPQRYTAAGSGIVAALQAAFPDDPIDLSDLSVVQDRWEARSLDETASDSASGLGPAGASRKLLPPGSNASVVIVLLSDGRTNVGIEPLAAARLAADRGVRVFTVGFGTAAGGTIGFGGGWMRTQLDEDTLKGIAEITGGQYFHATSAEDLRSVYASLTTQFVAETQPTEITAAVAVLAFVLLVMAIGLRIRRF
ncbi:MAG: VWA domain-containing protein [Steroidobacteraceae bacterium]|nr:VWA domain-containing protein [Pseudomonadales bacterium]MCP5472394.1 VWA domain-containing protein [Nevskiaceae bacterium]